MTDEAAGRKPHPDCVEYLLDDGRRFAWSESNVRYEEVPEDGVSFTLLRSRLTEAQNRLSRIEDASRVVVEQAVKGGRTSLIRAASIHALREALDASD